jgi:hypothetical protein
MDNITIFLNSISYKFPKGYPDINDPNDFLILENELKKLGINLDELKESHRNSESNIETKNILDVSEDIQQITDEDLTI